LVGGKALAPERGWTLAVDTTPAGKTVPAKPVPAQLFWLWPLVTCVLLGLAAVLSGLVLGHLNDWEQPPADKWQAKGEEPQKRKDLDPNHEPDKDDTKKAKPAKAPAPAPKEVENSIRMKLVLIPKGKFTMGSPAGEEDRLGDEDEHEVEITRPFYLGKYEVTKGEFAEFVRDKGYKTEPEKDGSRFTWRNAQTDRHPVVYVSWNDAVAFCNWLGEREGNRYRLPTEAEWEYSCRAGTKTRFHSGDDEASLKKVANYFGNSGSAARPVGSLEPNAFGLYDMHGNVWEWCQDWYGKDYYKESRKEDPEGPDAGASRVMRGGSCCCEPRHCRAASRNCSAPSRRYVDIGFRVVCVP
jgi:formylglycine-generating enzyme required for sulfatase activity